MRQPEIRGIFFNFFISSGHQKVLSSPLVPAKDPTLLFTNAGMNQFKGIFLQEEKRDYNRAVTVQKCMRVSGKHNDFDEVGKTDFHHTFFEMLGNFSFGDYFKEAAITYAWELLTHHYGLPPEKLWITVFREDEEAARLWEKEIGVPAARIQRRDEKDNFWQMGDTGPCGPCSEIHYDRGEGCGAPDFVDGNRRYVEVWNLVFMQFFRDERGELHPLPAPSIDTGMGMERLTTILQKKNSNYDTDLFWPIIETVAGMTAFHPEDQDHHVDFKVIADHARALAFLIADGVIPANEGRGYVLRRILRRAVKHGKSLNLPDNFLGTVCARVIELMSPFYPELPHSQSFMLKILQAEEDRFNRTLASGLKIFDEIMSDTLSLGRCILPGKDLFKLADTYGFPLDFARDLAMEKGVSVDFAGFQKELEGQRERSRQSQKEKKKETAALAGSDKWQTEFCGYDELELEAEVKALYKDGKPELEMKENEKGILILNRTPFYAEAGGQVGDSGTGKGLHSFFNVVDTRKNNTGAFLHDIEVEKGHLRVGETVRLEVDHSRRQAIAVHHSVTHLLHAALREIVGGHVKQSGSYVGPEKLRFDFTHFQPLTGDELEKVEILVNTKIRENMPVSSQQKRFAEALHMGAMAIFEEKYGDLVRMIQMGDFSLELCGGTHLNTTGEIGVFNILAETSISAGIRRIEAVAGLPAFLLLQSHSRILSGILSHFNQSEDDILAYLQNLEQRFKEKEKEIKKMAHAKPAVDPDSFIKANLINGRIRMVVGHIESLDPKALSALADDIKTRIKGITVLFTTWNGKTSLVVSTWKDLTKRFPANIIIQKMAASINGKGGGRADFAQAGGEKVSSPDNFRSTIIEVLGKL